MIRRPSISSGDSVIDSRDIIERIEELQDEKDSEIESLKEKIEEIKEELDDARESVETYDAEEDEEGFLKANELVSELEEKLEEAEQELTDHIFDDEDELSALTELAEKAEGYSSDWRHGEALINESYWVEYVQELLQDIGDLPKDIPSYIEIDWEKTADNIAADYMTVDWEGTSFYIRCS